MNVKILEKKRNEVMKRNEVIAEVNEKTIPSKKQLREKLAALLNSKEDAIAIYKVESKFGSAYSKIFARVYENDADLKKNEVQYIRERNFGKEKKEEATGAEAPPANFKK